MEVGDKLKVFGLLKEEAEFTMFIMLENLDMLREEVREEVRKELTCSRVVGKLF